jgi:hypothetical protein
MNTKTLVLGAALLALGAVTVSAQTRRARPRPSPPLPPIVGRWDLTVQSPDGPFPSWLEVERSGWITLVGQYVAQGGSARPISRVHYSGGRMSFTVPVQWERPEGDIRFDGRLAGDRLTGTMVTQEGKRLSWTGVRAPSLKRYRAPQWGDTIDLFNGRSLTGWKTRKPKEPNGWVVESGLLRNKRPGNDLVTTQRFTDFKLHAEFRYPRGSNSGIYLRGRYEAQIEDNYGQAPEAHKIGGIHGFLTPRVNAAKPAGEWQTYDITLVGRRVTIVLNGQTVLEEQEIPGITGGALDSKEGEPGPIFLQGDHGPVDFRALTLTPAT